MSQSCFARKLALAFAAFVLVGAQPSVADPASALFNEKCSSCHGTDGSGKTAAGKRMHAADLHATAVVEMSDTEMFESIGRGTRHKNYPHSFLFTGLNEQQVRDLVAHIRTLQKEKK